MSQGAYIGGAGHGRVLVEAKNTVPDLYREIFTHSNEPIAIISPDGHYIEQNAAHRNLLG